MGTQKIFKIVFMTVSLSKIKYYEYFLKINRQYFISLIN